MRHGAVAQVHDRRCPRNEDGSVAPHRCRNSWRYVLEYGKDSTGRRLQKTKSGFPTRAAAHEALAEVVRQLGLGATVHSLTVGQYLEDWLLGKHALKPKTVAQYRDMTENYLMPHLGRVRLLELRASHLDAMYAAITIGKSGRPLSPSTIRRIHAVLRSALNTAVKRRMIPYSPAEHIELAPENPKRPRPWNISEARVFPAQVSTDRLGPLYELMLSTGLRRGEAIGLRWQDVDLDGGALFVVQQITEVHGRGVVGTPKTRRGTRVVALDPRTVDALHRHRATQELERAAWGPRWNDANLVFTREDGLPLRPEYATRHFMALVSRMGLPRIRLHDLRHTHATLALAAGVEMKIVSDRLGHSQISVTADLYTQVTRGVARTAANQIADVLRGASDALPTDSLQKSADEGAGERVPHGRSRLQSGHTA